MHNTFDEVRRAGTAAPQRAPSTQDDTRADKAPAAVRRRHGLWPTVAPARGHRFRVHRDGHEKRDSGRAPSRVRPYWGSANADGKAKLQLTRRCDPGCDESEAYPARTRPASHGLRPSRSQASLAPTHEGERVGPVIRGRRGARSAPGPRRHGGGVGSWLTPRSGLRLCDAHATLRLSHGGPWGEAA